MWSSNNHLGQADRSVKSIFCLSWILSSFLFPHPPPGWLLRTFNPPALPIGWTLTNLGHHYPPGTWSQAASGALYGAGNIFLITNPGTQMETAENFIFLTGLPPGSGKSFSSYPEFLSNPLPPSISILLAEMKLTKPLLHRFMLPENLFHRINGKQNQNLFRDSPQDCEQTSSSYRYRNNCIQCYSFGGLMTI